MHPDGSINYGRPKTTDFGRRKIELLRRFHGKLINTKDNKMDYISNVFVSQGGTDVITLSIYNREPQYEDYKFKSNSLRHTYIPGEKLPFLPHVPPTIPEGVELTEQEKSILLQSQRPKTVNVNEI